MSEHEKLILDAAEAILRTRGVYFYQRRHGRVVIDSIYRDAQGSTLAEAVAELDQGEG